VIMNLQMYMNEEELVTESIRCAANFSVDAGNVKNLCDKGLVNFIMDAMQFHPQSERLQLQACRALAALHEQPSNVGRENVQQRTRFAQTHAGGSMGLSIEDSTATLHPLFVKSTLTMSLLRLVIQAMKLFPKVSDLLQHGLRAVALLSTTSKDSQAVRNYDGIEVAVKAMARFRYNEPLVQEAVKVLSMVTANHQLLYAVRNADGIPAVIQAMSSYYPNTVIQEAGLAAMSRCCLSVPALQAVLGADGINTIARSTMRHRSSAKLTELGARAIAELAERVEGMHLGVCRLRDSLGHCGPLAAVLMCCVAHPGMGANHGGGVSAEGHRCLAKLCPEAARTLRQVAPGGMKDLFPPIVWRLKDEKELTLADASRFKACDELDALDDQEPVSSTTLPGKLYVPILEKAKIEVLVKRFDELLIRAQDGELHLFPDCECLAMVLGYLGWHSKELCQAILEVKGHVSLLKVVQAENTDVPLQRACLGAVANLCVHGADTAKPVFGDHLGVNPMSKVLPGLVKTLPPDAILRRLSCRLVALGLDASSSVFSSLSRALDVLKWLRLMLLDDDALVRRNAAGCVWACFLRGGPESVTIETLEMLVRSITLSESKPECKINMFLAIAEAATRTADISLLLLRDEQISCLRVFMQVLQEDHSWLQAAIIFALSKLISHGADHIAAVEASGLALTDAILVLYLHPKSSRELKKVSLAYLKAFIPMTNQGRQLVGLLSVKAHTKKGSSGITCEVSMLVMQRFVHIYHNNSRIREDIPLLKETFKKAEFLRPPILDDDEAAERLREQIATVKTLLRPVLKQHANSTASVMDFQSTAGL